MDPEEYEFDYNDWNAWQEELQRLAYQFQQLEDDYFFNDLPEKFELRDMLGNVTYISNNPDVHKPAPKCVNACAACNKITNASTCWSADPAQGYCPVMYGMKIDE
jgi:hypothetical protein